MLDEKTFFIHFERMTKWFGKKNISVDLWYERLKNRVPTESFEPVIDAIIDSAKYFPTPQDVINGAQDWLQGHPEKQSQHHETFCPECDSSGAIKVIVPEKRRGIIQERLTNYRCKSCKNWEGRLGTWIPAKYRWEIERIEGARILTPYIETEEEPSIRWENPKEMDAGMAPMKEIVENMPLTANDDLPF